MVKLEGKCTVADVVGLMTIEKATRAEILASVSVSARRGEFADLDPNGNVHGAVNNALGALDAQDKAARAREESEAVEALYGPGAKMGRVTRVDGAFCVAEVQTSGGKEKFFIPSTEYNGTGRPKAGDVLPLRKTADSPGDHKEARATFKVHPIAKREAVHA